MPSASSTATASLRTPTGIVYKIKKKLSVTRAGSIFFATQLGEQTLVALKISTSPTSRKPKRGRAFPEEEEASKLEYVSRKTGRKRVLANFATEVDIPTNDQGGATAVTAQTTAHSN